MSCGFRQATNNGMGFKAVTEDADADEAVREVAFQAAVMQERFGPALVPIQVPFYCSRVLPPPVHWLL